MDQHRALYGFDCGPWRLNRYPSVPSLVTAYLVKLLKSENLVLFVVSILLRIGLYFIRLF